MVGASASRGVAAKGTPIRAQVPLSWRAERRGRGSARRPHRHGVTQGNVCRCVSVEVGNGSHCLLPSVACSLIYQKGRWTSNRTHEKFTSQQSPCPWGTRDHRNSCRAALPPRGTTREILTLRLCVITIRECGRPGAAGHRPWGAWLAAPSSAPSCSSRPRAISPSETLSARAPAPARPSCRPPMPHHDRQ